jgi:hypothetical protein
MFTGIVAVPFAGGTPQVVISNLVAPESLVASGNDILFADDGVDFINGTLQTVPKSGGTARTLLKGVAAPWNVLVDRGFGYAATLGNASTYPAIVKVDLDGGKGTQVVQNVAEPVAVVADSENIYWVDVACGSVMKAPK